jgi:hypothetical protein
MRRHANAQATSRWLAVACHATSNVHPPASLRMTFACAIDTASTRVRPRLIVTPTTRHRHLFDAETSAFNLVPAWGGMHRRSVKG